jgi:hypothetical protein
LQLVFDRRSFVCARARCLLRFDLSCVASRVLISARSVVLKYVPKTDKLKVQIASDGDIGDMKDELNDGQVQYVFMRFKVDKIRVCDQCALLISPVFR